MPISVPPLFIAASLAVIISPGPDLLYVISKGISRGRGPALMATVGFVSGLSVHTALAVSGISALVIATPAAFQAVKIAGALYLAYLGIRLLRSTGDVEIAAARGPESSFGIFRETFIMNALNPKVALFFLAFLPQFTVPGHGPVWRQMLILGGTFAALGLCVFSLAAVAASAAGAAIRRHQKEIQSIERILGALLLVVAVRLLLT